MLVIISSTSAPICNHFHTIRAKKNNVFLGGYPSLTPSFEKILCTQGYEILSQKTRDLEAAHGEDFVILACTVFTQYSSAMDGQTDRQTNGQTPKP